MTPCEAPLIPFSTGEKVFIALAILFFLAFAIYDSTTPPRV